MIYSLPKRVGFSLVEALVAIAILSFAVVALCKCQWMTLQYQQLATELFANQQRQIISYEKHQAQSSAAGYNRVYPG